MELESGFPTHYEYAFACVYKDCLEVASFVILGDASHTIFLNCLGVLKFSFIYEEIYLLLASCKIRVLKKRNWANTITAAGEGIDLKA